jgi:hypothetical protein
VTSPAISRAEEESLARGYIPWNWIVGRRRAQAADVNHKLVKLRLGQPERRHTSRRNAVADDLAKIVVRVHARRRASDKRRSALATRTRRAVTAGTQRFKALPARSGTLRVQRRAYDADDDENAARKGHSIYLVKIKVPKCSGT